MTGILIFYAVVFVLVILGLLRNQAVYNFRMSVIERVYANDGTNDWIQRSEEFHNVSYNQMFYQFWRPLTIEEWFDTDIIN